MPQILVVSTAPNKKEANKIARDLVQRSFAACVNLIPVSSHYKWKGKVIYEPECLMIIKTHSRILTRVKSRILALHKYQVPEIVALKIDDGYKPYLKWIDKSVLK